MIIFLDFDGVLHPDAVFRPRIKPLALRAEGSLIMHVDILETVLNRHQSVKIVLSTSWARDLGFNRTVKKMPEKLAERVESATWHKGMLDNGKENDPFSWISRYEQIASHVKRNGIKEWLAIDDLHSGEEVYKWPLGMRHGLNLTDGVKGLGCLDAQQDLVNKLSNEALAVDDSYKKSVRQAAFRESVKDLSVEEAVKKASLFPPFERFDFKVIRSGEDDRKNQEKDV